MIEEACFESATAIFTCVGTEVFGNLFFASIGFMFMFAYLLYRSGVSFTVSVPLALVFVFAMFWIVSVDVFASLALVILFIAALILAIVIIRHFFR